MTRPVPFPLNDAARARLAARARREQPGRHAKAQARVVADEARRAMPERLMLAVLVAVILLTITPVALLATVGY